MNATSSLRPGTACTQSRISIAILALGGQGGGVLADWIQHVARNNGWQVQGTSVPGVAQRTGSTVYYVELAKMAGSQAPVMAQMPVPGDVDIVIASELMEAGRAMLRGFSTAERTTLIGSTHRIYAISEKIAMGDGRGNSEKIIEAAYRRAKRYVGFDMEAATEKSGSVISAVMFGALAGSGALPFTREKFEDAIKASGIAVLSNLRGFEEGFRAALEGEVAPTEHRTEAPTPSTPAGRELHAKALRILPKAALDHAIHGLARLSDYQDIAYASVYLDRLELIAQLDRAPWELTNEAARFLALWMSYEDTIRVADLKTRRDRFARVRTEVRAEDSQLLSITEYMHPRLREVCETMPAGLGSAILGSRPLAGFLDGFFRKGRHVKTTSLSWYMVLRALASLRRIRRNTLRFREEQARIDDWLCVARMLAREDVALATAWIRCARLIKGYSETFERGLRNYGAIRDNFLKLPAERRTPAWLSQACDAALSDDTGKKLEAYFA